MNHFIAFYPYIQIHFCAWVQKRQGAQQNWGGTLRQAFPDVWLKAVEPLLSFPLVAGLIRLRSSPPPHLQGVEYVLNVTATDDNASGGPQALSSTAQVIVGVDDVNNNKPVFEKVKKKRAMGPCLS